MQQESRGSMSVFFILDIPVNELVNIFKAEGFAEVQRIGAPPASILGPGIEIGPPRMPVGLYKNTRIEYIMDRYQLHFLGPITELMELRQRVPALFEQRRYRLDEVARYCEFQLPFTPIDIQLDRSMRSKVRVTGIRRLNELCECSLRPFRLSLSNSDTPLSDDWLHITIQPDVNRPHKDLMVEIVRRTRNFGDMAGFLDKVESIMNGIKEILESD